MRNFTKTLLIVSSIAGSLSALAGHGWKRVNYKQSTIFTAVVTVNEKPAQAGDVVGIFVDGECRMLSTVFILNDTAFISSVLHGDKPEKTVIKYWSAAENKVYVADTSLISKPDGEIDRFPIKLKSSAATEMPTLANTVTQSSAPKLYPNSASSQIKVVSQKEIQSLSIINTIGNVEFSVPGDVSTVDISSLAPGLYFAVIAYDENKVITRKFTKE